MNGRIPRWLLVLLLAGYCALMGAVVWGMFAARKRLVVKLSTPEIQASWQQWRVEAAHENATHGPVQRVVPKSPEPPSLVLMRDYFPACLIGLLIPLSAIYVFIAWLICGVMRQAKSNAQTRTHRERTNL